MHKNNATLLLPVVALCIRNKGIFIHSLVHVSII